MTAPASPAPAPPETASRTTEYVILKFNEGTDEWSEHGDRVKATNRDTAVRRHIDGQEKVEAGTYVAVPAGSFQPVTVKAEVQTTIKLEAAK